MNFFFLKEEERGENCLDAAARHASPQPPHLHYSTASRPFVRRERVFTFFSLETVAPSLLVGGIFTAENCRVFGKFLRLAAIKKNPVSCLIRKIDQRRQIGAELFRGKEASHLSAGIALRLVNIIFFFLNRTARKKELKVYNSPEHQRGLFGKVVYMSAPYFVEATPLCFPRHTFLSIIYLILFFFTFFFCDLGPTSLRKIDC